MENLSDLVSSEKSGLQKLWEKLPGIKGYEKLEDRRDTDKIVRENISKRFSEQWDRISAIEKDLAKGMGIIYLGDLESAALKIRQFADRIKTAAYGYAGLSDAVKVDDIALQQLYDYDLYLFTYHVFLHVSYFVLDIEYIDWYFFVIYIVLYLAFSFVT